MTNKQKIVKLLETVTECIPDLKRYVNTHGPGPDTRLETLENTIEEITK